MMDERKQKQQVWPIKCFTEQYVYSCTWQIIREHVTFFQEDKLQKQAMRAQLATKKNDKEIQKWESGKYALECITTEIDHTVAKSGSIGGLLIWRIQQLY